MRADPPFVALVLPGDLPEPVVPQFLRATRVLACPEVSALPLTAVLAAVLARYTGHEALSVGDRPFRVASDTTVGEIARQAGPGADREIRLGPGLTLGSRGDALTAEYETDRYSPELVEGLLTDMRRVLGAPVHTTVAELGIHPPAPPRASVT
ncbi:hypothetical protein, partial [Streptomyces hainanensis]